MGTMTESDARRAAGLSARDAAAVLGLTVPDARRNLNRAAVEAGVKDRGYSTVRFGWVADYAGEAVFNLAGRSVRATGFGPDGDAQHLAMDGEIRYEILP